MIKGAVNWSFYIPAPVIFDPLHDVFLVASAPSKLALLKFARSRNEEEIHKKRSSDRKITHLFDNRYGSKEFSIRKINAPKM